MSDSSALEPFINQITDAQTKTLMGFFAREFDGVKKDLKEIKDKPANRLSDREVGYVQTQFLASDRRAVAQAQTDTDDEAEARKRWWEVAKSAIYIGLSVVGGWLASMFFRGGSLPVHHP